jgi:hypothetical protein
LAMTMEKWQTSCQIEGWSWINRDLGKITLYSSRESMALTMNYLSVLKEKDTINEATRYSVSPRLGSPSTFFSLIQYVRSCSCVSTSSEELPVSRKSMSRHECVEQVSFTDFLMLLRQTLVGNTAFDEYICCISNEPVKQTLSIL